MPGTIITPSPSSGLKPYYQAKIEAAELEINQKTQNLRRLEAQRNALNARGQQEFSQGGRMLTCMQCDYCGRNCNCSMNPAATSERW